MPGAPNVAQPEIVHRSVRLRLWPGSRATAQQLAGTAGACRFVWNYFLAGQSHAYQCWREYRIRTPAPGTNPDPGPG